MLSTAVALAAFVSGVAAWTLTEYVVHRWSMHGTLGPAVVERGHRRHHGEPQRRPLASPLAVTAVIVLSTVVLPVIGARLADAVGAAWCAGALVGPGWGLAYLAYERVHFHSHFGVCTTSYGRWAQRRHLHHHFVDGTRNYNFAIPIWDVVFRTARPVPADVDVAGWLERSAQASGAPPP
ncbi:MAG TPA: sterol desaturase family protein [Acidimicrobiales bacterium]|nr:sterol desaturase family protein [Acidimicrobiales bacterium]